LHNSLAGFLDLRGIWFTQRREGAKGHAMRDIEEIARLVIDCGFRIHKELGPGLLESVYEAVLANGLRRIGLAVDRQRPIDFEFEGVVFREGFRADLLIENQLIIELKSVERLAPVHGKQLLTYPRLAKRPLGLLMNFGGETFREGIKRVVNNHAGFAPSRLCVNQISAIEAIKIGPCSAGD
jgi:GxxExxY protein